MCVTSAAFLLNERQSLFRERLFVVHGHFGSLCPFDVAITNGSGSLRVKPYRWGRRRASQPEAQPKYLATMNTTNKVPETGGRGKRLAPLSKQNRNRIQAKNNNENMFLFHFYFFWISYNWHCRWMGRIMYKREGFSKVLARWERKSASHPSVKSDFLTFLFHGVHTLTCFSHILLFGSLFPNMAD